jgi:hypothetical protein
MLSETNWTAMHSESGDFSAGIWTVSPKRPQIVAAMLVRPRVAPVTRWRSLANLNAFPFQSSRAQFAGLIFDGWTRGGSPSIFGNCGGYGASPSPWSCSSRSAHSSNCPMS